MKNYKAALCMSIHYRKLRQADELVIKDDFMNCINTETYKGIFFKENEP